MGRLAHSWTSGLALTSGVALLAVAGCTPPHPHPHPHGPMRHISTLDCPEEQGDLELKSGGDGQQRCVYGADDAQVTLQLVNLENGGAQSVLAPIETRLKAEVPGAATTSSSSTAPSTSSQGSRWDQGNPGQNDHDRVDLDLPGLHIHTRGDGHADVDTSGVHIHANGADGSPNDRAQIVVDKGVRIDAHQGGAQIEVAEPGPGVRLSYLLESDAPGPHGWRVGAYEARGPEGGPIVVAEILGKDKDSDDLRHDVHELLRRNVGG